MDDSASSGRTNIFKKIIGFLKCMAGLKIFLNKINSSSKYKNILTQIMAIKKIIVSYINIV